MERKEFLEEKYQKMHERYTAGNRGFYANPSIAMIEPFRIADSLYYVGDKKVCVHLIDAGEGLILLDSGFPCALHLLVDSIWRAGFDPRDVRWILHTHGHYDHFGASEEFRRMYGSKLAISKVDAESLRQKPHRAHLNKASFPYAEVPVFDYEIEDGEIFEFGNVKIRCVLTPGHSAGVLSFFFDVKDNGKTYLAGLFGGAGINALSLPYISHNEDSPDCPRQMLRSLERIWNEPVVVHLGNHPYNSRTMEKRRQQLQEGGNPFIAQDSWHTFLGELKEKVEKMILQNQALEEEMITITGQAKE